MKLKRTRLLNNLSTKIALGMMLALPMTQLHAKTEFYGGVGVMASFVKPGEFTPFGMDATFTGNNSEKYPSFDTQMGGESFIGAMFGNFGTELSFTMKTLFANDSDLAEGINFPSDAMSVDANGKTLPLFDYTNMIQNGARISGIYKMKFGGFQPYISAGVGTNVISGIPLSKPLWGFAFGGKVGADFKLSDKMSIYAAYDLDATMSGESSMSALIPKINTTARSINGTRKNSGYFNADLIDNMLLNTTELESIYLVDTVEPLIEYGTTNKTNIQSITNIPLNSDIIQYAPYLKDRIVTTQVLEAKIANNNEYLKSNNSCFLSDDTKQALIFLKSGDTPPEENHPIKIDSESEAIIYYDTNGTIHTPEGKANTAKYYLINDTSPRSGGTDIYPFIDGTYTPDSASDSNNQSNTNNTNNFSTKEVNIANVPKPTNPMSFSKLLTHNIVLGVKFNF